jgi:hypothetical protein
MVKNTGEAKAAASSITRSAMGFKASQHAPHLLQHTSCA